MGYREGATPTKLDKLLSDHPQPRYVIAGTVGIHPTHLSQYALGRKLIPPEHIMALCEYLHVSPTDLIGPA